MGKYTNQYDFYSVMFICSMEAGRVYAVVLSVLFLLAPVYALAPDGDGTALLAAGVVIFLLLGVYIGRDDDEGEDTDSWSPIPSRQYGGRYAELGGLTRDEQEEAVREVQEKADDMESENNS